MKRTLYEADHDAFRDAFRSFVEKEVVPHDDEWDAAGIVDRELFRIAGANGFLGFEVDEQYGAGGAPPSGEQQRLVEPFGHQPTVGQPSELVVLAGRLELAVVVAQVEAGEAEQQQGG